MGVGGVVAGLGGVVCPHRYRLRCCPNLQVCGHSSRRELLHMLC